MDDTPLYEIDNKQYSISNIVIKLKPAIKTWKAGYLFGRHWYSWYNSDSHKSEIRNIIRHVAQH